uniref:Ribonuclease H-like domain-containing protein n=1 Tax=Tanacetum cinerariifolium TaxID=118510 RepID=A0A6L2ME23_TANCI|nr:ribonuclease H-like domain-containing protein [Tanacetum cinerariifolium]
MEQYLTFTDHALWDVIVNGDSVSSVASASSEDEHLLKFHACKDAKSLWEAIKNRFGGNKESKKMQKTILKQNYKNFAASSQERLDKTYHRFQKLIAWNNIALIIRNKSDLDTLSMDDLYNNLKVYESEIKIQSNSSSNSQNVAFVSSDNSTSTNKTVNTANGVFAASSKDQVSTASYADDVMFSFFSNQSNAPQLDNEDLEQIDTDDEERVLWVELKRLFEQDDNDGLWESQIYIFDITWRLYDTCGVHHISTKKRIDIYMLVEKEYPLSRGIFTQMLCPKLLVEEDSEMCRELIKKIFMQVERPGK